MSWFTDYKYAELLRTGGVRRDTALNPRSQCLRPVSGAFFENVARMDSFCLFPAEVAATALQTQLWKDYAILKVTGKLKINDSRRFDEKTEKAIAKEIKKLKAAQKRKFFAGKDDGGKRRMTEGVAYINKLLGREIGAMQSMEAILFSVVVESWMAFETLAADLWFTALDHGPAELRKRTLLKAKKFKSPEGDEETFSVREEELPDPGKLLGSFLKEADKISFQKLRLIVFWYKTAFGTKSENLFKEVSDGYIFALSAVRNVIIHKAGQADKKYITSVKSFPELSRVAQNKFIHLDGEIARKLSNAAISLGHRLLLFVDETITPTRSD